MAPSALRELLSKLPPQAADPALLVGFETGDDAAVYRLDDERCIVASTDFFAPIVDDPGDYGRIAAANALSDIYAVGGRPVLALAVAGFPVGRMPRRQIERVLAGGAAMCAEAGVALAGGHTVDAAEPVYGLAAIGLAHPARIKRNCDARAGDRLILGKGLGIGILAAAVAADELDPRGYRELVETATRLNAVGAELAEIDGVNAMTDVTGFGLVGHLLEMCEGAGIAAVLEWRRLPILPAALSHARQGRATGATGRNWASFGGRVTLPDDIGQWRKNLLADPQTSGGLLVSCAPAAADRVLALLHARGHTGAAAVGEMTAGAPGVAVRL